MIMQRVAHAIVGALALVALAAMPAGAQTKGLLDANEATEGDLVSLPHMTPAIGKGLIDKRPFKTVIELNKYLLDQKLTAAQAKEFVSKLSASIS